MCAQENVYIHCSYPKCAGTGNIALGKSAIQSGDTKHDAQISSASRAVDGRRETCIEFERSNYSPWWSVDLGDLYNIAHVTITSDKFGILLVTIRIVSFHVQFSTFQ